MTQTPALAHLLETLDALAEPAWCEGVARTTGPIAIALPGGDVCTTADPAALVAWLRARAEPAPFGAGDETRLDPSVRASERLTARGTATIRGLELADLVAAIETELATDRHVHATLADVLVYPVGGMFARHKDTPRSADQLGTLVVNLPVAHEGGTFVLVDGGDRHEVDWSGPVADPHALRWVAMFGDVDHEIAPVTAGSRVTLVYALALTATPRKAFAAALDAVSDAMIAVLSDPATLPDGGDLLVPCSRMIIAPRAETPEPLAVDVLRGSDRAIAQTLARCGVRVGVREILLATDEGPDAFPAQRYDALRVTRAIPDELLEGDAEAATFDAEAGGEYLDDDSDALCFGAYLDPTQIDEDAWLVRRSARATVVYEGMFSSTGYFGNECDDQFVYQIAALEVSLDPYATRVAS